MDEIVWRLRKGRRKPWGTFKDRERRLRRSWRECGQGPEEIPGAWLRQEGNISASRSGHKCGPQQRQIMGGD